MKRLQRILGIVMTLVMVFAFVPVTTKASVDTDGYSQDELARIRAFLNLPSKEAGKTNGQQINSGYQEEDPSTWTGVTWTDTNPYYVGSIGENGSWRGKNLAGELNLSGFSHLRYLDCSNNFISTLNVTGTMSLYELYCNDNQISQLDIGETECLEIAFCNNNLITSFDFGILRYVDSFDFRNNRLKTINYYGFTTNIKLYTDGNGYVGLRHYYNEQFGSYGYIATAEPAQGASFIYWYNNSRDDIEYPSLRLEYDTGDSEYYPDPELLNPILPLSYETMHNYTAIFAGTSPSIPPSPSGGPTSTPTPDPIPVYRVEFDLNGGTHTGGGVLQQYIQKGGYATPPTTELDGYRFVGWDGSYENIEKDVKVKAIWEKIIYTFEVTFDRNGGIRTGGGQVFQTIVEGESATAPTLRRSGYTFDGWDKSFDNIKENLLVTAKWIKNDEPVVPVYYTLTYDVNGGEGNLPVDDAKYLEGDIATIADEVDLMKEGYDFLGWSYDLDGDVIEEAVVSMTSNVTLYAVWIVLDEEPMEEPNLEEEPTPEPVPEPEIEVSKVSDIPKTGEVAHAYPGIAMLLFGGGIVSYEVIRRRKLKKEV